MRQATYTCDACGKSQVSVAMPMAWRRLCLVTADADLGDDQGDVCSPDCAAAWARLAHEADL
jgi:hypothetical protein